MAGDSGPAGPDRGLRLRKISLNPLHWHQVRRLLLGEAVVLAALGIVGLVSGFGFTRALCVVLLALAAGAAVAATHRRLALTFCAVVAVAALILVIICAVAAAHAAPGPLGFNVGEILLYAAGFVYHFALAVWLIPDQIEGPEWIARKPGSGT